MSKAKGFNFGTVVTICGKDYLVDIGTEEKQAALQPLLEREAALREKKATREVLDEKMELAKEFIAVYLGEGAWEEIFKDRIPQAVDVAKLLLYIKTRYQAP